MKEDKRTEKEILSNIEDYARETMHNTKRTAQNVAFQTWVMVMALLGSALAICSEIG